MPAAEMTEHFQRACVYECRHEQARVSGDVLGHEKVKSDENVWKVGVCPRGRVAHQGE